jgi:Holliday junction resolvase
MPNPAYARGNYFERRIADDLRHNGYLVWQSRGSKTVVDLVALKRGQVLLIQAKSGLTQPSHEEWNTLLGHATRVGGIALVADRGGRGVTRYRQITHPHIKGRHDWPAQRWTADDAALAAAMARHPAGSNRDRNH